VRREEGDGRGNGLDLPSTIFPHVSSTVSGHCCFAPLPVMLLLRLLHHLEATRNSADARHPRRLRPRLPPRRQPRPQADVVGGQSTPSVLGSANLRQVEGHEDANHHRHRNLRPHRHHRRPHRQGVSRRVLRCEHAPELGLTLQGSEVIFSLYGPLFPFPSIWRYAYMIPLRSAGVCRL